MKKLLASLLVLACVAPAMAAGTITFGTPVLTTSQAVIPWTATEGVVGMALTVDCSAGVINVASVQSTPASFFDVFVDSAFTAGAGYVYKSGIPTAKKLQAGELALPQASFSISVGGLDDTPGVAGDDPVLSGSITLQSTAGATVAVCEDTLRGGVVAYSGPMAIVGLCKNFTIVGPAPTECVNSNAPFYAAWLAFNKPSCWCYPKNCKGDADGRSQGNATTGYAYVSTNDLTVLAAAWNVKEPPKGLGMASVNVTLPTGITVNGICADFNRDPQGNSTTGYARVSTNDLPKLSASWNIKEPPKGLGIGDCAGPNYNFFTTAP